MAFRKWCWRTASSLLPASQTAVSQIAVSQSSRGFANVSQIAASQTALPASQTAQSSRGFRRGQGRKSQSQSQSRTRGVRAGVCDGGLGRPCATEVRAGVCDRG
nr:hypothetical protein Itr_chr06CG20910 [Ipomoea trifida]